MEQISESDQAAVVVAKPSPGRLLWVWLLVGVQSFGGGTATLYLIRRAVVEQHGWISDEEFTRHWAISQVTPGINLLCLTTLIGWQMGGALGVLLSLVGLLLPSVAITVLLTVAYAGVRDLPVVRAALRGVVPATIGLGLLLSFQMGQPLLRESGREGRASLLLSVTVLALSGLAALLNLSVVGILFGAGAVGGLGGWLLARRKAGVQP